jgi:hypothetical protein
MSRTSRRKRNMLDIAAIRSAVADYMFSEGYSCCEDSEAHDRHEKVLAKMLQVPSYTDGSGYDFYRFRTKAQP